MTSHSLFEMGRQRRKVGKNGRNGQLAETNHLSGIIFQDLWENVETTRRNCGGCGEKWEAAQNDTARRALCSSGGVVFAGVSGCADLFQHKVMER